MVGSRSINWHYADLYYWWDEGLRRNHPVVIEPEILMSNYSFLSYNAMSWGYWTAGARDSEVTPFVSMYKAVTRGRHLTHLTERSIFISNGTDAPMPKVDLD